MMYHRICLIFAETLSYLNFIKNSKVRIMDGVLDSLLCRYKDTRTQAIVREENVYITMPLAHLSWKYSPVGLVFLLGTDDVWLCCGYPVSYLTLRTYPHPTAKLKKLMMGYWNEWQTIDENDMQAYLNSYVLGNLCCMGTVHKRSLNQKNS